MSNPSGQKLQQSQCSRCKRQIPLGLMCMRCQDLEYCTVTSQVFRRSHKTKEQTVCHEGKAPQEDPQVGAASKHKSKRKKRKNKLRQGPDNFYGQTSKGNGGAKGVQYEPDLDFKKGDGEKIKVDAAVKTGESFGEDWWKLKPTAKKAQVGDLSMPKVKGSEATVSETKLKYKDFYSDSEDEAEVYHKLKEMAKADKSSDPVSAAQSANGASLEEALSALQLERNNNSNITKEETKKTFSDQGSSNLGKCSFCKKEGFVSKCSRCKLSSYCNRECQRNDYPQHKVTCTENISEQSSGKLGKCSFCKKKGLVSKCSRCKLSSYCNRECQRNDYPRHKIMCRRKEIFSSAKAKIPEALKRAFLRDYGSFVVSPFLADLPEEYDYPLVRYVVMAEIIGPYFHIFRPGIIIRDLVGKETHIVFYIESDIYKHVGSDNVPVFLPLATCLKPGNFILLLDTCWHLFLDFTTGIRINDLDDVHFILEK